MVLKTQQEDDQGRGAVGCGLRAACNFPVSSPKITLILLLPQTRWCRHKWIILLVAFFFFGNRAVKHLHGGSVTRMLGGETGWPERRT